MLAIICFYLEQEEADTDYQWGHGNRNDADSELASDDMDSDRELDDDTGKDASFKPGKSSL